MDFNFKKMFGDIRNHLTGLTVSQKMLIATLVVGITVGLIWLVNWAGEPVRVPLLDQSMSAAEIARTTAALGAMNVAYKVEGDRVMVPSQRRQELLGRLSAEAALPANIDGGYDEYLKGQSDIWKPPSERRKSFLIAKMKELANQLRYWPGVRRATVNIDNDSPSTIASSAGDVTAAVALTMTAGHKLTRQMARGIANHIASSISDIKKDRISVSDVLNGQTFRPLADTEEYSTVLHELRDAVNKKFHTKLSRYFNLIIPHVRCEVNVTLTQSTKERIERNFDKAKSVVETLREESTRSESTKGSAGPDAGVRAMAGMTVTAASTGNRTEDSSEKSEYMPYVASEYLKMLTGKGGIEKISATLTIPSTYVIRLVEAGGAAAPTFRDGAYTKALAAEAESIREQAANALGIDLADAVKLITVRDYLFLPEQRESAVALAAAGGGAFDGVGAVLDQYGKPVLLGVVALVSLFLVASMVKRAAPAPLVIRETVSEDGDEEDVAGEAEQLEGVLQGIEVDEDTLRVNSMVEQVNEMIGDNLDSATGLVRRWIQEDS